MLTSGARARNEVRSKKKTDKSEYERFASYFRVSDMGGRIALKFALSYEYILGVLQQKLMVGYNCTCACAHPFSESQERFDG